MGVPDFAEILQSPWTPLVAALIVTILYALWKLRPKAKATFNSQNYWDERYSIHWYRASGS